MLNRAGAIQLVSDYRIQNTGIDSKHTEARVVEKIADGAPFEGGDSVKVFAPPVGQP